MRLFGSSLFGFVALAALVAAPVGSIVYDVPTDAELVGRWIEDREAGLARPADHRVQEIPGPRSVRQEANWLTLEDRCEKGPTPRYARWVQWDDGFSRIRDVHGECCDEQVLSTTALPDSCRAEVRRR